MKNLMKIFAVVVLLVVVLSGCSTSGSQGKHVSGRFYGTTQTEAAVAERLYSEADFNESLAGVLDAVSEQRIAPESAAVLFEVVTPIAAGQRKSVYTRTSRITRSSKSDRLSERPKSRASEIEEGILEAGQKPRKKSGGK